MREIKLFIHSWHKTTFSQLDQSQADLKLKKAELAIKDMSRWQIPRTRWFSSWYKQHLDPLASKLLELSNEALETGAFPLSLKELTFQCFIRKEPFSSVNYWPISLINVNFKILTVKLDKQLYTQILRC